MLLWHQNLLDSRFSEQAFYIGSESVQQTQKLMSTNGAGRLAQAASEHDNRNVAARMGRRMEDVRK